MGLDMYAWSVKDDPALPDTDYEPNESAGKKDLEYWRKFNNLHGWMERLYERKGGRQEFNCVSVRVAMDDLDQLAKDANNLAPTGGFFFGSQDAMTDQDVATVKHFIVKAREAINSGLAVYYDSWW